MGSCNSRNSTRKEDWQRFGTAWLGLGKHFLNTRFWVRLLLHTGKNIIVEEARRHGLELRRKKCK